VTGRWCRWLTGIGVVGADHRPPPVVSVRPYAYLVTRGDTPVRVNPVPRGLMTRRQGGTMRSRMAPLVRVPRTLPRVLSPEEADRLVGALRTHRDRAMVLGMLLAGLRRCEVLGLGFEDVQVADRWLAVVKGKGGHTCLTRLREAGMALEAVQAQAGHATIESTRVYLHLANDWLAGQYLRAAELIDADTAAVAEMLAVQQVAAR
jgi:integrase